MGCFFPCFSTSKQHKKRLQSSNVSPAIDQKHEVYEEALKPTVTTINQETSANPINYITESKEKLEDEQLSCHNEKNVTIKEVVVHDLVVVETSLEERETVIIKREDPEGEYLSSKVSYPPPNHRYDNCANSDDECVDTETEKGDSESEDRKLVQEEESSESLFSLSIDSRKHVSAAEMGEKEVSSPMPIESKTIVVGSNPNARDRSQYVHSVLNPIENLTQWQAVKAIKGTPPLPPPPLKHHQLKENINSDEECRIPLCPEPRITRKLKPSLNQNEEMAVDTSLSSWLVKSETTPMSRTSSISVGNSGSERVYSPLSREDRPILGELTIEEEIKQQFTATSSPNRSPSRSPDDIPNMGTVGSYLRHTGQNMDSDSGSSCKHLSITPGHYKEDKKVNLQGTPFETRLERALDIGIAQV